MTPPPGSLGEVTVYVWSTKASLENWKKMGAWALKRGRSFSLSVNLHQRGRLCNQWLYISDYLNPSESILLWMYQKNTTFSGFCDIFLNFLWWGCKLWLIGQGRRRFNNDDDGDDAVDYAVDYQARPKMHLTSNKQTRKNRVWRQRVALVGWGGLQREGGPGGSWGSSPAGGDGPSANPLLLVTPSAPIDDHSVTTPLGYKCLGVDKPPKYTLLRARQTWAPATVPFLGNFGRFLATLGLLW